LCENNLICKTQPNIFYNIQEELLKTESDTKDLRDLDYIKVIYKLS